MRVKILDKHKRQILDTFAELMKAPDKALNTKAVQLEMQAMKDRKLSSLVKGGELLKEMELGQLMVVLKQNRIRKCKGGLIFNRRNQKLKFNDNYCSSIL